MTQYSKYNVIYRLQKWMDSVPGQTFLNYAYSWGASVVIAGTLFKLTHLPGANLMLFLGMGTEVVVFFLSAFDRPFDKTTDGMELPTHVRPQTESGDDDLYDEEGNLVEAPEGQHVGVQGPVVGGGGGTIILGGGSVAGGPVGEEGVAASGPVVVGGGGGGVVIGGGGGVIGGGVIGGSGSAAGGVTPGMEGEPAAEGEGTPAVAAVGPVGAGGVAFNGNAWVAEQQKITPEMADATDKYVEELKKLTEMLEKVNEQSARLARDSEEMENLNRTLTGISKVYEMQLKGASQQIGTIDQINEQSRKMAQQIEQLNKIYARMIEAMTVNMRAATPRAASDDNTID